MNIENIKKLMTKEDPFHIHKILGIISLSHFAFRYYNLIYNFNSMNFNTNNDIYMLSFHFLLSTSSFQFIIPKTRNKSNPMIYPEYRLHNLIFSYRSIICTLLFYYKFSIIYNILICYLTMIGADIITYYYKDGTTIRNIQFESNVTDETKKNIKIFNSKMQICATLFMLGNIDSAFGPLFAIQLSSFLMTLVRKNIIKTKIWHFVYGLSLMINVFINYSLRFDFIIFHFISVNLFSYLRFTKYYNKYLCWTIIYVLFLIYRLYPFTITYDTTIKTIFLIRYLYNNLSLFIKLFI